MSVNSLYHLFKNDLFNINRSITGKGTLKTLLILKKKYPFLKIKNFKCQKKVFDWKIPPEWNVSEAYVEDRYKQKIIDFKKKQLTPSRIFKKS